MLTADAVAAGGRDNITVVVVDAIAVTTRPGTIVLSDDMDDVDADTRPRETVTGGVR